MSQTRYSAWVWGNEGNYGWPVRFDLTGGYLGISQETPIPGDPHRSDRVLLSPQQLRALLGFLKSQRRIR